MIRDQGIFELGQHFVYDGQGLDDCGQESGGIDGVGHDVRYDNGSGGYVVEIRVGAAARYDEVTGRVEVWESIRSALW